MNLVISGVLWKTEALLGCFEDQFFKKKPSLSKIPPAAGLLLYDRIQHEVLTRTRVQAATSAT